MDEEGEHVLSTRPQFPQTGEEDLRTPWREHWIQAIYYPTWTLNQAKKKTEHVQLYCSHDEFSFRFSLDPDSDRNGCSCGIHCTLSRSRLKVLNNFKLFESEANLVSKLVAQAEATDSFLYIGSSSYLPLIVAKLFPHKPVRYLSDPSCSTFFRTFSEANDVVLVPADTSVLDMDRTFLLMEPHCQFADLPTDLIHLFGDCGIDLSAVPADKSLINRAVVKCLPVEFNHLWKTRTPAGPHVMGFDISDFHSLIRTATSRSDCSVESYPVWEYPCRSRAAAAIQLFDLNWEQLTHADAAAEMRMSGRLPPDTFPEHVSHPALCFWADFYHWDSLVLSCGPEAGPGGGLRIGEYVKWSAGVRLGVALADEIAGLRAGNFCCTLRLRKHSRRTFSAAAPISSSASLSLTSDL